MAFTYSLLLSSVVFIATVHGKPQDVVFPEESQPQGRPPFQQGNGNKATTPSQFPNNFGNLPSRPRPQNFPNQNNFPQTPNQNNFPQTPNQNNFPQTPNQNNFPNQPGSQNNFPQPSNQNPTQSQTTQSSSGVTPPPAANATTTRIPPRDPGNRIVYLVPAGCNCPFTNQYSPVCGTDGQTYGNMGVLQCNKMCGKQVEVYLVGACGRNNG